MNLNYTDPNFASGANDSERIQNAVNEAKRLGLNKVVIPRQNRHTGKDKWVIHTTVRLPSDIEIVLDNCFLQMADDVVGGFFCSETLFTEKGCSLEHRMRNIRIRGEGNAVLDGGKPTGLSEKTQKERGVPVRLNTPIFFMNVEGFSVENISITNHRYWGMRFQFCSDGILRNIFINGWCDSKNQDGINLRNGCNNILIENVHGQSGDDMIALSAIDRRISAASTFGEKYDLIVEGHDWDIHDVTIRNISGAAIHHPLVALRNHNGAKIYNINIENIRDTPQLHYAEGEERFNWERYAVVVIGSPNYFETVQQMGDVYNISVSGVYAAHSIRAVFGACTIRNSSFRNIYASGVCRHVFSVQQTEGWDMHFAGMSMENVLFDGINFTPDKREGAVAFDFSIMRDTDYTKGVRVTNMNAEGIECFAEIAESAKDRVKLETSNCSFSAEGEADLRYVNRTRVFTMKNP